jgi:hypothetical protein
MSNSSNKSGGGCLVYGLAGLALYIIVLLFAYWIYSLIALFIGVLIYYTIEAIQISRANNNKEEVSEKSKDKKWIITIASSFILFLILIAGPFFSQWAANIAEGDENRSRIEMCNASYGCHFDVWSNSCICR